MTRPFWITLTSMWAAAALFVSGAAPVDDCGSCCGSGSSFVSVGGEQPATRPSRGDDYPLENCPVMDVAIDSKGKPVVRQIDGRTVKLCCQRCARTFEQDKEKYHAKMDQMVTEVQKDTYPLETCVVSGEKLGGMGEPVNYVHRPTNQLVRFCCEGCIADFKKGPGTYLAKISEAKATQKSHTN